MEALEACGPEVHSKRLIHFVQASQGMRRHGGGCGMMKDRSGHLYVDR